MILLSKEQSTGVTKKTDGVICELLEKDRLNSLLEEYITACHQHENTDSQKVKRRSIFPNIAGFCRYVGTGLSDFYNLQIKHPAEYDRLLAVFEDEALNSDISAAMLSSYIKMRMLYFFEEDSKRGEEVGYYFEHDIYADGE